MKFLLLIIIYINTVFSYLHPASFTGVWKLYEKANKSKIYYLSQYGSIYKPTLDKSKYVGFWELKENKFNFIIKDKNIDKKYYGLIANNSLFINGEVCEGLISPNYLAKFTMVPIFQQFHNISYVNTSDPYIYVNFNNVTGRWLLENVNSNQLFIIELYYNNSWQSVNLDTSNYTLKGKWNLFNESKDINVNSVLKLKGKNIWLAISKKLSYVNSDFLYIGKIIQLGSMYYYNEDAPSTTNSEEKITVSSKINGSVCVSFDFDPEISESFYMKRWF